MEFNWSATPPKWEPSTYQLLMEKVPELPPDLQLETLIQKSEKHPIKFPVDTNRCKTIKAYTTKEILEENINSTYPVVHENVLELFAKFLLLKRKYGNTLEQQFYSKMGLLEFVDRLLIKRAVMFMGKYDKYILINGEKGSKNWETIGTLTEKPPLILKDCLSYDEIKLAAFLSVSSYSYFVNLGQRKNHAVFEEANRSEIEPQGVIIGLIGTRLRKEHVMEYQELVITSRQNTQENGYGTSSTNNVHQLFAEFYEDSCLSFNELEARRKLVPKRYEELKKDVVFDNELYYRRMSFSIDTMLIEANERAKSRGTTAYLHVVGLGLGVWMISKHQEKVYMEICAARIRNLGATLGSISDICFSYIKTPDCGGVKDGEMFKIKEHPLKGVRIHISNREPHSKLTNKDSGKLLVVSYAWDGNALPGNEYWDGKLGSSGDSAAASSTQITELHNPHINSKVCAHNLRIITRQHGIMNFAAYQEKVRCLIMKKNNEED